MQNIQEVFLRIQQSKKKQKEIRSAYKAALDNLHEYGEVSEQLTQLKERKKKIEMTVKEEFSSEFGQLDRIKLDLAADQELLSDIALNTLVAGESVKITDNNQVEYEPLFSVRFKKVN